MTPFNYGLLLVFGVIAYIMIVDPNVNEYLTLVFKMTKINIQRFFWMVKLHPKNPITNLIMKWEYQKIAKELKKELSEP